MNAHKRRDGDDKETSQVYARATREWRATFDSLKDAVALLDDRARVVRCNQAMAAFLDRSFDAIFGQVWWDLCSCVPVKDGRKLFEHALQTGARQSAIVSYRDRAFDMRIDPVKGETGDFTGAVVNLCDITAHKQAQAALEEANTRLKLAVKAAKIGHWDWDLQTNDVFSYPAWEGQLGYEEYPTRKEGWLHLLHDEDRARVLAKLKSYIDGQAKDFETELRVRHKDGSYRWSYVRAELIHDDEGKPVRMVGCHIDITERKQAEEEKARLAAAIEYAAEAVIITDIQGNIQYVNPAFERVSGYTRDEVIGKNPRLQQSGKHDAAFYADLWKTISHGKVWSGQFINKRKNGSLYEEEGTISPVFDSSGAIVNFVAIKRDVTGERKLEHQLRHSQKLEAIGTLAGGIAHDFNNVLAAIIGYSEFVAGELPVDSPLRSDMAHILTAADRAKDLIQQILTFSRRTEQERMPIELHLVAKEALKLLRPSIPAMIEIVYDIDTQCGSVLADPTQIHQVLMNLCTNANHAMQDKGGTLTVMLNAVDLDERGPAPSPDLHPGRYVRLTVSDTGCGMSRETMSRIFDPFFTTKERGEGTGLGLATVHGIVKSHGGAITVYSEAGIGSTFHVYLPCVDELPAKEEASSECIRGGNERILIVDDETPLAEITARTLVSLGYEVCAVSSVAKAIAAFVADAGQFDLVITDHSMPGATGLELAGRIRTIRADIPIILWSGFADHVDEQRLQEAGINAYLNKPVSLQALAGAVRNVLDKPGSR